MKTHKNTRTNSHTYEECIGNLTWVKACEQKELVGMRFVVSVENREQGDIILDEVKKRSSNY